MKSKFFLCLLLVSSLSFLSCSSDDDSSNNDSQFEDKWWYSPDNSTLDVFFNSDGTYESVYVFGGTTYNSDGEWEWVSESAKTFRVFNLTGNATTEYYGKVSNLTDNSMGIKMSLDEGETYSEAVPYIDTNE
jgi:hypothetical protein